MTEAILVTFKDDSFPTVEHVFLALIPINLVKGLAKRLTLVHKFYLSVNPFLKKDLDDLNHVLDEKEYIGVGFISYFFLGVLFGFLMYWVALQKNKSFNVAILAGVGTCFLVPFLLTYFLVKMPGSALKERAIIIDGSLNYALKELVLQNKSGAGLYESLVSIANSKYGPLTSEFDRMVREVHTGMPLLTALERMVGRQRSDYFKKAGWQLINTVKTGSEVDSTLTPIIEELDTFQKSQIQNYARELNLWSLVYMMFSVAIPTIGSTMLVVLSVFANMGVSEGFFIGFAIGCMLIQLGLIFLVKTRRPNVSF